jgi:hypothetical protein
MVATLPAQVGHSTRSTRSLPTNKPIVPSLGMNSLLGGQGLSTEWNILHGRERTSATPVESPDGEATPSSPRFPVWEPCRRSDWRGFPFRRKAARLFWCTLTLVL